MRIGLLLIWCLFDLFPLFSQERCATMQLPQNQNRKETPEQFEKWIQSKREERKFLRAFGTQQTVLKIPVVFHVIHDGSPVGTGSNISESHIIDQVRILNEDFRRMNADTTETPSMFSNIAADSEIEFVLAKQDPEGLATDGIVRILGSQDVYRPDQEVRLMAESYWPHDDYLNIYVTDLSGANLGYAQFPFSNLSGIATELENYSRTDGVVLDYKWVGTNLSTGSFDSYGRTATHEIGHWLGLRHIWGDGGCGFDDYCNDTPEAGGSSTGCSTNKTTCESQDMIQNYMDYTDDVCMNLFTVCQKERMRTVLENSPRRVSLLTSHGLLEPIQTVNDLGIRSIVSPIQSDCMDDATPRTEIRNYGTNSITSYEVLLKVNNVVIETISESNTLEPGQTRIVSFSPITLEAQISNEITFEVSQVNGTSDQNSLNDQKNRLLSPFNIVEAPYYENFESNMDYFRITETGEESQWEIAAASYTTTDNQAAKAGFYEQTKNFGVRDFLLTSSIDLTGINSARITFNYAYAPRLQENQSDYFLDGLMVLISTDCGETYSDENILFERYGYSLKTANETSSSFFPIGKSMWDEISLNITRFVGQPNVQVAIVGVNGGGNNIYVDDLFVGNANLKEYDLGIKDISNISVVSCEQNTNSSLEIRNYGYATIDEMTLQVNANEETQEFIFNNLGLRSGESDNISLDISEFTVDGSNQFDIQITSVNGEQDQQAINNSVSFDVLIDQSEDYFPLKEDFLYPKWTTFSPDGTNQFDNMTIKGDRVLFTDNFGSDELVSSWLVTPTLSTDDLTEGSLQFKYSYAERQGFNDNLKVLLSVNCGKSYDTELASLNSEQLAVTTSSTEWTPQEEEDWRSYYIDLTPYVNWSDLRIAFVFSNGNGNRLFLDDINLYRTQDPDIPDLDAIQTMLAVYPNPAVDHFAVAFNFPSKQNVYIQLSDLSGRIIFRERYNDVLNDKLTFSTPSQSGFYILNVVGDEINQSKRVYIRH